MYYREANIGSYLRKQEDPGCCSLVMFREVFLRTKFTEKREFEREILRMHEFCVTRNVLL